jgi:hypothetical protein
MRQPLVATSAQHSRNNDKITPTGASPRESNRAATPRPKAKGISRNMSSRALSIPISDPSLCLLKSYRHKTDHQAYEASRRPVSAANISENATNVLPPVDRPPARPRAGLDETIRPTQSPNQSDSVKPNSGLKLRTPRSAKLQPMPVSGARKRQVSIYDLEDDEEIEDSENESQRHRTMWQTAAQTFGRSRQDWNEKSPPGGVECTLVPRTPSPIGGKNSVYLPRL